MALKRGPKKRQKKRRRLAQVVRGGLTRLKRPPAPVPLAEPQPRPTGILRPEAEKARVAEELLEAHQSPSENPSRLVLVIVVLACLWIAIIAWFVAQMEVS